MLQPLPAAQLGKKNAEPGKSLSVSSGVEGAGIDRAGAALASVARGLFLQPLGFGLSLALNNCSCVLIGATMLYNAYIISQGERCVSTLRSRRHRVRVGGRICGSLWVDPLPPSPTWLLLIPGRGKEPGEQGPTRPQLSGGERGWLGSLHHLPALPVSLALLGGMGALLGL